MQILGIDLAAEPKNTGTCVVEWARNPRVELVEVGRALDEARLLELIGKAERTGIDAPFGWPVPFVEAVTDWGSGRGWPSSWGKVDRQRLRLRLTDIAVHDRGGPMPLSVSADSIGVCAMRAAVLLHQAFGPSVDRVGGRAVEVYPAATLAALHIPRKGYKTDSAVRRGILAHLVDRFDLDVGAWTEPLVASDHALDALLSALSAAAASEGASEGPRDEDPQVVAVEGWIHVPVRGWPG